jgi:signal transduction histidine kinase
MKKQNSIIYHVIVFIIAQIAWFSLLALWIYWYVSNYLLLNELGDNITPQINLEETHIGTLIGGLILLVAISIGMSLIFIYLTRQMNLTRFYDNFIANVTHELKSPLSSIKLYLETMKKRKIPETKQNEFITTMLQDIRRLNNLINSILDISGMEQKRLAYHFEVYKADDIFTELIDEAAQAFHIPNESLKIEGFCNANIVIDRRAFKIVINNLFDNAIKYSSNPAKINICLSKNDKYTLIDFTDKGIGLTSKDQKLIFDKFQRIYKSDSPNVKGTGLGLYWVKEIIKSHGGKISVISEGTDRGSTFQIELPIYQTAKKRFTNRLLKITRRQQKEDDLSNE